jgi:hypothetical protein
MTVNNVTFRGRQVGYVSTGVSSHNKRLHYITPASFVNSSNEINVTYVPVASYVQAGSTPTYHYIELLDYISGIQQVTPLYAIINLIQTSSISSQTIQIRMFDKNGVLDDSGTSLVFNNHDVIYLRLIMNYSYSGITLYYSMACIISNDPYFNTVSYKSNVITSTCGVIAGNHSFDINQRIVEYHTHLYAGKLFSDIIGPFAYKMTDYYTVADFDLGTPIYFPDLYTHFNSNLNEYDDYPLSPYSGNQLMAMDYKYEMNVMHSTIDSLTLSLNDANNKIDDLQGQISALNDISASDVGSQVDSSIGSAAWSILTNNPITQVVSGGDHTVNLDKIFNDNTGGLKAIFSPTSGLPYLSSILTGGSDTIFDKINKIYDLLINLDSDTWDVLLSTIGTKILDTITTRVVDKTWMYKLLQILTVLLNSFSVEFY